MHHKIINDIPTANNFCILKKMLKFNHSTTSIGPPDNFFESSSQTIELFGIEFITAWALKSTTL
ncbi:24326_t:CDS:2 [Gigaspora rosea]|nr:24326_t:CDS:2 [Gigaspora rosea]